MFEKLQSLENRYRALEEQLASDGILKNQQKYQSLTKEFADLSPLVKAYRAYKKTETELVELEAMLRSEPDAQMRLFYEEESKSLKTRQSKLSEELETLLLSEDDPYKDRNIFIEIRAGTGGEEAALFASVLFRMYEKFADSLGFKGEIMSLSETGIGGFKEIIFSVAGTGCYPKFKFESGIHRVQRVPVTESSGRIHTSAVTVAVLPEAEEVEVEINPNDLRIDTFRASGAGGQHVNKTDSAIRITHLPTNMVVTCQDEKSQHKNKAKALRILRTRLYEKVREEQDARISRDRKQQVGSGDRSGRIRTYNFPEKRVTDHRIGLTLYDLDRILEGNLHEIVEGLEKDERQKKLSPSGETEVPPAPSTAS